MERLTFEGNFCDIAQCLELPCPYNNACTQRQVWERLKKYEDSGLSPIACKKARKIEDGLLEHDYSIERMAELMQADKDGRVVVLPAKTVYELVWDAGSNCDGICPVSIDGVGSCDFCNAGELCIYEVPCKQEHIERIGDDVFLTYEEAENGLEKLKNG